ncbi:TetR/AcrR family transcriptional regulator [Turicibacter sanguinis]|uniref:TetR/AcrR family transcriptional regulator n=1 Tax=Turicibacter sanguinis TaxID=154288 RepID=UPI0018AC2B7E|nr:TetR/AcrR family transcriptional regulator [Turicibacter sanguinis]MDB8552664.1 TetR/AcrR family transcriptional regulator [Turicibacter sanguinis]
MVKTKKDLIDAFWILYQQKEISKISVKEICEIAGYHRTTFYDHFKDIYDVLEQLEMSLIPPYEEIFKSLNLEQEEIDVSRIAEMIVNFFNTNKEYLVVLIGRQQDTSFQNRVKQQILLLFLKYFEVNQLLTVYTKYILEYQVSAVFSVISLWIQSGEDISKEELMNLIYTIGNQGVFNLIKNIDDISFNDVLKHETSKKTLGR